jgi:hypothetical protein
MNTAVFLRKELHTIIDEIPEMSLPAVKPLLTYLANDYWKQITEPANDEEIAMIEESLAEHPDVKLWKDIRKG